MELFYEEEIRARHAELRRSAAAGGPRRSLMSRVKAFLAQFERPEIVPCAGLTTC